MSGAAVRIGVFDAWSEDAPGMAAAITSWARPLPAQFAALAAGAVECARVPLAAGAAECARVLQVGESLENLDTLDELVQRDTWALGDVAVTCAIAERDADTLVWYSRMVHEALDLDAWPELCYRISWLRPEVVCGLPQLLRDACGPGDKYDRLLLRGFVSCPACSPATPSMRSEAARIAVEQIVSDPLLKPPRVWHNRAVCRFSFRINADAALVLTTERYGTDAEFRRRCTRSAARMRVFDVKCARRLSRIALAETAMALAGLALPALLVYEILDALHECCADAGEYFCRRMPELVGQLARRADTPSD
jgi:hypothetical protein